MSKNILIAGGAGFLGSHLAESLIKDGHRVTIVDNLCTSNKTNLNHIPEVNFIWSDIITLSANQFADSVIFDEVWNLACPASPPLYQKNPVFTLDTNYIGTKNLLELAYIHDAKFFQASTSEIYGDPFVHPQPESYWGNVNTIGPRSCYDEGKRIAETLCYEYGKTGDQQIAIARIFNTYGPRLSGSDGRVVSNFIKQALAGEPLTVYGDGSQTRSFCYVDDLIRGFKLLMGSDVIAEPVNLGNPAEFTILELASTVIKLTGSKSELVFMDLPTDDPRCRKPDITKAQHLLGWVPKIQLEEGLQKMIDYVQKSVV